MDTLRDFLNSLTTDEQIKFAARCGTTLGYLRKAICVKNELGDLITLAIERESNGAVRVVDLRPDIAESLAKSGYIRSAPTPRMPCHQ